MGTLASGPAGVADYTGSAGRSRSAPSADTDFSADRGYPCCRLNYTALSKAPSPVSIFPGTFSAQAAILYGAARLTADVDVTVALHDHSLAELIAALGQAGFETRISAAERFAEQHRMLLLVHTASRMPVDIIIAGPGPEEAILARSRKIAAGEVTIPVACPEDLIVMKLLAGRSKDIDDVSSILAAMLPELDMALMERSLKEFESVLDRSDLRPQLRKLVDKAGHTAT
jgi:hypothetical protein